MLCRGFDRKWFEKANEMHSGYLESKTIFEIKRALSLDRIEIARPN